MWSGFIFRSRWWWVSTAWKVWSSKFDIFLIFSADVIPMTSSLRYHLWRYHRSIHSYLSSFHTFQSHMWLTYILPICKFFFLYYKPWRHSIVLMASPWCQMVQKCFAPSNFIKSSKGFFILATGSSEFLKLLSFQLFFNSSVHLNIICAIPILGTGSEFISVIF